MPWKPASPCRAARCPNRAVYRGWCNIHKGNADIRPSNVKNKHGGTEWQKIRERVLRESGIPSHLWPLYDVDHDPVYPSIGGDHSLYRLTPMLHGEHSTKTNTHDGGFGRRAPRVYRYDHDEENEGPVIG